jgi:hypothetical protein
MSGRLSGPKTSHEDEERHVEVWERYAVAVHHSFNLGPQAGEIRIHDISVRVAFFCT